MDKKPSYDDIARATVPLPDSSFRPSRAEVAAAEARVPGLRISPLWPDDQQPSVAAVQAALEALPGADLTDLEVLLESGRATLVGSVASEDDRTRVLHALTGVPGVTAVIETLRVRT